MSTGSEWDSVFFRIHSTVRGPQPFVRGNRRRLKRPPGGKGGEGTRVDRGICFCVGGFIFQATNTEGLLNRLLYGRLQIRRWMRLGSRVASRSLESDNSPGLFGWLNFLVLFAFKLDVRVLYSYVVIQFSDSIFQLYCWVICTELCRVTYEFVL